MLSLICVFWNLLPLTARPVLGRVFIFVVAIPIALLSVVFWLLRARDFCRCESFPSRLTYATYWNYTCLTSCFWNACARNASRLVFYACLALSFIRLAHPSRTFPGASCRCVCHSRRGSYYTLPQLPLSTFQSPTASYKVSSNVGVAMII